MFPKIPSSSCHNKLPYMGDLNIRHWFLTFLETEIQTEGAGRLLLVRTPAVPSRPRAVILCLHMMDRGEGRKLPSAFSCVRAQLCPILRDTMDGSPPGSSVHETLQPRILEWVAVSFSRGSSRPRDWTCVSWISCIGRWSLWHWATWEALTNLGEAQTRSLQDGMWNVPDWWPFLHLS